MVRKILAALLLLLLLLPAAAFGENRVIDECGLFTPEETARMEEIIETIRETCQMDVVVLTTRKVPANQSSLTDEQSLKYADDYYDSHGFGLGSDHAGLLYLLDMRNRVSEISTCGVMIDYINDPRLAELYDAADTYLYDEKYGAAALALLGKLEGFIRKGIEEGSFRYDAVTGERLTGLYNSLTSSEMILGGLGGVGAAALMYFLMAAKYNLRRSTYKFNRNTNSSVALTQDQQIFERQTVTRTRISSGGGGGGGGGGRGSGVHSSSSGVSHGGGGGHHF